MKQYAKYGFKDFYIALGYKGEIIKKFFNKKFFDWNVNLIETGNKTLALTLEEKGYSWLLD